MDKIYRQSPECLLEDMGGDILLYHPSTASAIQLNESSRIIWQLCDGERSVGEIIAAISDLYPEQAAEITKDVPGAIDMLTRSQALELAN